MIRVTKVAKGNAVKARTSVMITLRQILVNAPDELRQSLNGLPKMTLIRRAAAPRPRPIEDVTAATKHDQGPICARAATAGHPRDREPMARSR